MDRNKSNTSHTSHTSHKVVYFMKEVAKMLNVPYIHISVLHKYFKIGKKIDNGIILFTEKDIERLKRIIKS